MASRKAERLHIVHEYHGGHSTRVIGFWEKVEIADIKRGDVFRLWEADGTPDHVIDGKHDVCAAVKDARPVTEGEGYPLTEGNCIIDSFHLNRLSP